MYTTTHTHTIKGDWCKAHHDASESVVLVNVSGCSVEASLGLPREVCTNWRQRGVLIKAMSLGVESCSSAVPAGVEKKRKKGGAAFSV